MEQNYKKTIHFPKWESFKNQEKLSSLEVESKSNESNFQVGHLSIGYYTDSHYGNITFSLNFECNGKKEFKKLNPNRMNPTERVNTMRVVLNRSRFGKPYTLEEFNKFLPTEDPVSWSDDDWNGFYRNFYNEFNANTGNKSIRVEINWREKTPSGWALQYELTDEDIKLTEEESKSTLSIASNDEQDKQCDPIFNAFNNFFNAFGIYKKIPNCQSHYNFILNTHDWNRNVTDTGHEFTTINNDHNQPVSHHNLINSGLINDIETISNIHNSCSLDISTGEEKINTNQHQSTPINDALNVENPALKPQNEENDLIHQRFNDGTQEQSSTLIFGKLLNDPKQKAALRMEYGEGIEFGKVECHIECFLGKSINEPSMSRNKKKADYGGSIPCQCCNKRTGIIYLDREDGKTKTKTKYYCHCPWHTLSEDEDKPYTREEIIEVVCNQKKEQTGIEALDKITDEEWIGGIFLFTVGGPGWGKTRTSVYMVKEILDNNPDTWILFVSLDMRRKVARFIDKAYGNHEWMDKYYGTRLIITKGENFTAKNTVDSLTRYVHNNPYKRKYIFIDYIGLLADTSSNWDYASFFRKLKSFAERYDCRMNLLQQIKGFELEKNENNLDFFKRLDIQRILGGTNFKGSADYIISVCASKKEKKIYLRSLKGRWDGSDEIETISTQTSSCERNIEKEKQDTSDIDNSIECTPNFQRVKENLNCEVLT